MNERRNTKIGDLNNATSKKNEAKKMTLNNIIGFILVIFATIMRLYVEY